MAIPIKGTRVNSPAENDRTIVDLLDVLAVDRRSAETLIQTIPFSLNDATAGSENEFQTCVLGKREQVDLPLTIEESGYYQNIIKRFKAGETPKKAIIELEKYVQEKSQRVWENSWVRFPRALLREAAGQVFRQDLLADKNNPNGPKRKDLDKFIYVKDGVEFIRVPVSYLLKLSLIEALHARPEINVIVREVGERVISHFLNDNTSPETFSFAPVHLDENARMGKKLAEETAKRFLLTQFLVMYANQRFRLTAEGQQVVLYFAPHPPVRQKQLNESISDSFYRELFMNPCLSGWDRGEVKFHYMVLCHQVLSRSHLNIIPKLKESGIIINNLVVLPNLSNISLANNGTHISLGSRKLTRLLSDPTSGFKVQDEKSLGDLAIKIVEHFLPLFVGTYSAAPYRLDFWDFHPEKALGFLPHELDYTHLRMIWRRWIRKADLKVFGQPVTPFGPLWLDRLFSRLFFLRGDFVQDFRLIDYLVALMSTEESPALNGIMGNGPKLKKDLADLGIFDTGMSLYLLYRLREFSQMGFSGFEGRYYSLFESLLDDLGEATALQVLITALAYKYIVTEAFSHASIPDTPTVESERRQIFFGTAISIPTFYVRKDTANHFLRKILQKVKRTRLSRRYPGYVRVYNLEYRQALLEIILEDGADLIELMGLQEILKKLQGRIDDPANLSTAGKLTKGILRAGNASTPLRLSGLEFNLAAETYYREALRKRHIQEAFEVLEKAFMKMDSHILCGDCLFKTGLKTILGDKPSQSFLLNVAEDVLKEEASEDVLLKLIHLTLLTIYSDIKHFETESLEKKSHEKQLAAPIY